MRIRLFHMLATTSLLLGVGAMTPRIAQAHASLNKCNIAPGAKLTTAPKVIACTFAEGVNPKGSFIGVFETTGDHGEVDKENSAVSFSNAKQLTVGVPRLSKGTYALLWYTISADDGHRAGGIFTFSIK